MSTHQVKNLKRMELMSGEESCIRMAWSLMGYQEEQTIADSRKKKTA
jgi:hypothetical protein